MKWTFKYLFAMVPARTPGIFGEVRYVPICTGGSYIADDEKTELELTDYNVILKNKQYILNQALNWLGSFVSDNYMSRPCDKGLIGDWSEDVDKNAKIYYCIQDDIIHKMFITIHKELGLSNLGGVQYVIEYNGKMMDCVPEDGDLLFDTIKEANKYKKKLKAKK